MEQNRHIRELVRILGKHSKGEKRSFDPLGGIREEQLVRHAVRSDIEGVTLGNDLNHLLPTEYCYLTDEALRPVFMQKFVENACRYSTAVRQKTARHFRKVESP